MHRTLDAAGSDLGFHITSLENSYQLIWSLPLGNSCNYHTCNVEPFRIPYMAHDFHALNSAQPLKPLCLGCLSILYCYCVFVSFPHKYTNYLLSAAKYTLIICYLLPNTLLISHVIPACFQISYLSLVEGKGLLRLSIKVEFCQNRLTKASNERARGVAIVLCMEQTVER